MNAYPDEVRVRARELWLRGGLSDEAVAEQLGVRRPGTVGAWRREERWDELRRAVDAAAAVRVEAERNAAKGKIDQRHDQIGEALEGLVVRCLKSGGHAKPSELRAIAAVALMAQRLRRTANRMDDKPDPFVAAPQGNRRVEFRLATSPSESAPAPAVKPSAAVSPSPARS